MYQHQGRYDEALECHKQALEIKEKMYEQNHPSIASSLNNIGVAFNDKGDYKQSIEFHERALAIRESIYEGANHQDVADSFNNIGVAHSRARCYDKSLSYYEKALKIRTAIYQGEPHPSVLGSLNNIGFIYINKKLHDKAIEYFSKALIIEKLMHQQECHPSLAIAHNNIGLVYNDKALYDKALEHFTRASEILEIVYKITSSPELATITDNIGLVLSAKKDYEQSLRYYNKALRMREAQYHRTPHLDTANSLSDIAIVYTRQKEYDKALDFFAQSLKMKCFIYKSALHLDFLKSIICVELIKIRQKKHAEVLEYSDNILKLIDEMPSEQFDHDVAGYVHNIGLIYDNNKQYDNALKYYITALEIRQKIHQEKPYYDIAISFHNIGLIHNKKQRYDEALRYNYLALEVRQAIHQEEWYSHLEIAFIYDKKKEYHRALVHFDQFLSAIKIVPREDLYSKSIEVESIAWRLYEVAVILDEKKEYDASLKYYSMSLQLLQEYISQEEFNSLVADCYSNRGAIYREQDKYEEALEAFHKALEIRKVLYRVSPDVAIAFILASSFNSIGSIYNKIGDRDKSRDFCSKGFEVIIDLSESIYIESIKSSFIESIFKDVYNLGTISDIINVFIRYNLLFIDDENLDDVLSGFHSQNMLEHFLELQRIMMILAELDPPQISKDKHLLSHNSGCMYNVVAIRAEKAGDSQKASEHSQNAESKFRKALEYVSSPESMLDTYVEYANFLVLHNNFIEAFNNLDAAILLADQEPDSQKSELNYAAIEKEVVVEVLQRAIDETFKKAITVKSFHYAYYLIISNHEKFIEAGIKSIKYKHTYLADLERLIDKDEDLNYVSYLMLGDIYNILGQTEKAAECLMLAKTLLLEEQERMQRQSEKSEQELDDETMQGTESKPDQDTERVQVIATVLCAKAVYSNKLLNSPLGEQLLEKAYKIGGYDLYSLVLDLSFESQIAEEMLTSATENGAEVVVYRLLGKEVKKQLFTIKTESGEIKTLVLYTDRESDEVLNSEIREKDQHVLKLDVNQTIKQSFYEFASMLYGATMEQAESILQKAKDLIQLVVDSVHPALQTDEEVGLLTFLYDILGALESGSSFSFPASPRNDPNPDDFGGSGDSPGPDDQLGNSFGGLFGQINSNISNQSEGHEI